MTRSMILMLAGLAAAGACVSIPDTRLNLKDFWFHDEASVHDAIGYVGISSPTFAPIESEIDGDSRLQFGDYRKEANLIAEIMKPQIGITDLQYRAFEAALAANVAGTRTAATEVERALTANDRTVQQTRSTDARPTTEVIQNRRAEHELLSEQTRTFQSPDVPEALPAQLQTPADVAMEMAKVFARSGTPFSLAPDQVATLVAAYKTYMVNLEEYYNVDFYRYDDGIVGDYVPYKVHFTVTAEPGWFTRYHQHDALAEITFGGENSNEFLIASVSPPETAQTIDRMTARMRSLAAAVAGEGAFNAVALAAQVRALREDALRLEGLQSNKTLVVGFPSHNRIRVRFRAESVPTEEGREVQPTSRMLTAIVLVRREARCGTNEGNGTNKGDRDEQVENALAARAGVAGSNAEASAGVTLKARPATLTVHSYFAPTARDVSGDLKPPRNWIVWESRGGRARRESVLAGESRTVEATVPPHLGDARKPLSIAKAFGYYWGDFADAESIKVDVEMLFDDLQKKEKALADAEKVEKSATEKHAALKKDPKATPDEVAAAKKQLDEAMEKAAAAKASAIAAKTAYDARLGDYRASFRTALQSGRIAVCYDVHAPTTYLAQASSGVTPKPLNTFMRVKGHGIMQGWTRVGRGDVAAVWESGPGIDLTHAIEFTKAGELLFKNMRVFLEVGVAPAGVAVPDATNIRKTAVSDVVLEPRARTSALPPAPKPADAKKDDAKPIQIDLEKIELELHGVPAPTPTPAATN